MSVEVVPNSEYPIRVTFKLKPESVRKMIQDIEEGSVQIKYKVDRFPDDVVKQLKSALYMVEE